MCLWRFVMSLLVVHSIQSHLTTEKRKLNIINLWRGAQRRDSKKQSRCLHLISLRQHLCKEKCSPEGLYNCPNLLSCWVFISRKAFWFNISVFCFSNSAFFKVSWLMLTAFKGGITEGVNKKSIKAKRREIASVSEKEKLSQVRNLVLQCQLLIF